MTDKSFSGVYEDSKTITGLLPPSIESATPAPFTASSFTATAVNNQFVSSNPSGLFDLRQSGSLAPTWRFLNSAGTEEGALVTNTLIPGGATGFETFNDVGDDILVGITTSTSTDPVHGQRRGFVETSSGTTGLDITADGAGKSIQMITNGVVRGTFNDSGFTTGPSTLPSFVFNKGTWTPTLVGETTAGTTTYIRQFGEWTQLGNLLFGTFNLEISAATGTGNALIQGLPFGTQTIVGGTWRNLIDLSGWSWPIGTTKTSIAIDAGGFTFMHLLGLGSNIGEQLVQMQNAPAVFRGTIIYSIF